MRRSMRLSAGGVAKSAVPVMEPAAEPWGRRIRYEADPEGNPIEIGSFGV